MVTTEHKVGLSYKPVGICGFPFEFITPFITDGYTTCIETGTYHGNTTLYLADLFHSVWTIEFSEEFFSEAQKKFVDKANITAVFGDSREQLGKILDIVSGNKVVLYLDAHYSVGNTKNNISSLINELELINFKTTDSIIVVDDARIINMTYCNERYAELPHFINILYNNERYISMIGDQYIAVPYKYKEAVDAYSNKFSMLEMEHFSHIFCPVYPPSPAFGYKLPGIRDKSERIKN